VKEEWSPAEHSLVFHITVTDAPVLEIVHQRFVVIGAKVWFMWADGSENDIKTHWHVLTRRLDIDDRPVGVIRRFVDNQFFDTPVPEWVTDIITRATPILP
jgi:hypothetical protein